MVVYHVDKLRSLIPGKTLFHSQQLSHSDTDRNRRMQIMNQFYSNRLSIFGVQALDDFPGKLMDFELTELLLDYVRAIRYPDKPSRLTVMFASRSIEEAKQWFLPLALRDCEPQLVELETSDQVYAANVLFRDEVNSRIAALCEEFRVHPENPASEGFPSRGANLLAVLGSTCLVRCMDAALAYWSSLIPVTDSSLPCLYEREELLLVPPVRVLRRVAF